MNGTRRGWLCAVATAIGLTLACGPDSACPPGMDCEAPDGGTADEPGTGGSGHGDDSDCDTDSDSDSK